MSTPRPRRQAGPDEGTAGTPTSSARTLPARAALLLTLLLLVTLAAVPAGAGVVTDEESGGSDALAVVLTGIAPAFLVPDEDLTVTGTVTNTTTAAVERPALRLRMQLATPISRSILERWLEPDSRSATTLLAHEEQDPLEPGEARRFTVTVPAAALPLARSYVAWGPRGLEVEASDAASPQRRGSARSFLVWWPELDLTPTSVAVLGALTPTAAERVDADATGEALADAAAPRLGPLLAALDRPDVDIAFDPALLGTPLGAGAADTGTTDGATASTGTDPADAPEPGGPEDEATGTPPAQEANPDETASPAQAQAPAPSGTGAEMLAALDERASGPRRDVHALPWADADVAALTHAEREDLLASVSARTDDTLDAAGIDASTTLAWPAAQTPDLVTVRAAARAGAEAVVLPSGSAAPSGLLTYTPTGRATLDLGAVSVPAVLADERMSAILSGHHRKINAEDVPDAPLDALTARQYLLAESAVIARERPSDGRALLLALPRDFAGDAEALAERLDVLADAPWITRVGIDELLSREVPDLERDTLPERVVEPGEMTAADLESYSGVMAAAAALASATPEPERLLAPVRETLLPTLSVAWRSDPAERDERIAAAEAAATQRSAAVAARPGSDLLLINDETHIPVSVTNGLDQSVSVQVRLEPRDVRLVAEDTVPLEIPAQQSATAQVPVHAVGSGDVVVDVLLESQSGDRIGQASEIQVRVRADWENVGTAVLAGVLVLMLVVGLVRTVRRGRRRDAFATAPTHADEHPTPPEGRTP